MESGQTHMSHFNVLGGLSDAHVPFPRISGARFNGIGQLVTFNAPKEVHARVSLKRPLKCLFKSKFKNRE